MHFSELFDPAPVAPHGVYTCHVGIAEEIPTYILTYLMYILNDHPYKFVFPISPCNGPCGSQLFERLILCRVKQD